MTPTKAILLTLFAVNVFAMIIINLGQYLTPPDRIQSVEATASEDEPASYRFDEPFVAYHLLEKLDVSSVVEDGVIRGANYTFPAGAFKLNSEYCKEHRHHFVSHPEETFQGIKFITNYRSDCKVRTQVIAELGQDLHPLLNPVDIQPVRGQYIYDMRTDANIFFTEHIYFLVKQVGKQFSCLTQESNHIPGHDKMYRKDSVGQALVDYARKYATRPQCFNHEKYFPKTWLLTDVNQCKDFFEEFNSARYQKLKEERNVVYFRKIGADVHEGKGVFPVTTEEDAYIRTLYGNGTLCGQVRDNNLIQYNIHNPLLLNDRKFGFRAFLLVASTNPTIAYYHDGYLRLSLDEYDANSKDIKTFVTNIGVNLKEKNKNEEAKTMTPDEVQEYTTWFLEKFQTYLLENGVIEDPDWLNNYLRPEFKRVMIHLVRMAKSGFEKKSSVFELYGVDFVMDADLGLWFIEANTMPLISGFTKDSTILLNRMLTDMFEITSSLLRSRAKRIILYINELTEEMGKASGVEIPDLERKRVEFAKVIMNKFDPEFEISSENTFERIIDENEIGEPRYSGLLAASCL